MQNLNGTVKYIFFRLFQYSELIGRLGETFVPGDNLYAYIQHTHELCKYVIERVHTEVYLLNFLSLNTIISRSFFLTSFKSIFMLITGQTEGPEHCLDRNKQED